MIGIHFHGPGLHFTVGHRKRIGKLKNIPFFFNKFENKRVLRKGGDSI